MENLSSKNSLENKGVTQAIILGLSLLLGLCLLGLFIFQGIKTFSDKDRVVTVNGLAEMEMKATAATIVVNFSFSGDDLENLIAQTENKRKAIIAYLTSNGYAEIDILIGSLDVTDRQKYYETRYQNGEEVQVKIDRYTMAQSLVVKAKDVETTEQAATQIHLDLVTQDLTAKVQTNYSFPELNSIKPQLIAESTKNARIAGQQFANDSQANLGKIKTASQGQISISENYHYDETSGKEIKSYLQKARVVSEIVFFLE
ncbi:MAG: SIMPL domain-containing protein [Sporomusaceae bacterium]|jgi:hypothetical protein|nr:SIMPL domain-containing protein [Sporomusaceae bacterium]